MQNNNKNSVNYHVKCKMTENRHSTSQSIAFKIAQHLIVLFSLSLFSISSWNHVIAVDFMGGDGKCVQHKIVLPMYVSYTSIPTSTANTTMKSTKLLTKPYSDVTSTSTSAVTTNLSKPRIPLTSNSITKKRNRQADHIASMEDMYKLRSMSFNLYKLGSRPNDLDAFVAKKSLANPSRTMNISPAQPVHNRPTAFGCGYKSRSNKYTSSDDARTPSIDYNFNYAKFRSPLNSKSSSYLDSSKNSTPTLKLLDNDKWTSQLFPQVPVYLCPCHYPNCHIEQRFQNRSYLSYDGVNESKYFSYHYPCADRPSKASHKAANTAQFYNQDDVEYSMKRTISHDRVYSSRPSNQKRRRPKSYCSSSNHCT